MKQLALTIAAFGLAMAGLFAQSPQSGDILGTWLNEDQDAHILVYEENGKYFGKIIWLKFPIDDETGQPKLDKKNPDDQKKSEPVMGMLILEDFVFEEDEWDDGSIYDPKSGKTYDCYIRMNDDGNLRIRGYIGISLIGRTTYWTRVE